ncbi:MAG: CDP-glycerol glycerophosphotransferase family protein [Syntrophobacteraceae bacterium]
MSDSPRFEVVVIVPNLSAYLKEPINQLYPWKSPLLNRDDRQTIPFLKEFQADVNVVDNHYPPAKLSPLLVNVWHGSGWRGLQDKAHFKEVYRSIKRLTGLNPDKPNPALIWTTAGETRRQYRIGVSGFHPDNVLATGQTYTDDIVQNKISRDAALCYYPPDFAGKKICLFAPTWHFGRIFSHWGDDEAIIQSMIERLSSINGALILRMHDRKRFDAAYLAQIESLCARYNNVVVKFKDEHQDNLLDMTVADCMVSNYSSMLTFFYGTGKPSIHAYPFEKGRQRFLYRIWKRGKVRVMEAPVGDNIWSLSPEETGGPIAHSVQETLDLVEMALTDSTIGNSMARQFIEKHCAPYDGNRCGVLSDIIEQRADQLQRHN